jgi:hypothetical protein
MDNAAEAADHAPSIQNSPSSDSGPEMEPHSSDEGQPSSIATLEVSTSAHDTEECHPRTNQ